VLGHCQLGDKNGVHETALALMSKGSLQEQVEEEKRRGTGTGNRGSPGSTVVHLAKPWFTWFNRGSPSSTLIHVENVL